MLQLKNCFLDALLSNEEKNQKYNIKSCKNPSPQNQNSRSNESIQISNLKFQGFKSKILQKGITILTCQPCLLLPPSPPSALAEGPHGAALPSYCLEQKTASCWASARLQQAKVQGWAHSNFLWGSWPSPAEREPTGVSAVTWMTAVTLTITAGCDQQ